VRPCAYGLVERKGGQRREDVVDEGIVLPLVLAVQKGKDRKGRPFGISAGVIEK